MHSFKSKNYILAEVLRKRKHDASINQERKNQILKKQKAKKDQKKEDIKHPESYIIQYRRAQKSYAHLKKIT